MEPDLLDVLSINGSDINRIIPFKNKIRWGELGGFHSHLSSTLCSSPAVWILSQEYKYYTTSNTEPKSL